MSPNFPDGFECEARNNMIKFSINGISTDWMDADDSFIKRIDKDRLNSQFPTRHLIKEIEIKNSLDESVMLSRSGKCLKAIAVLDEVLFYDPEYGEALLVKSRCLRAQGHFVKALRYYRRAVKAESSLEDIGYHKALSSEAKSERDSFPKLKRNIYAGDEHFANAEYGRAIESYDRALKDQSKFKQRILSRLLNKKATAYLKLDDFQNARDCFSQSLDVERNDYAIFGRGVCEHGLKMKICDEFRGFLDISKRQMLRQATILNDEGCFGEALEICMFLCENHFAEDDFYIGLIDVRRTACEGL